MSAATPSPSTYTPTHPTFRPVKPPPTNPSSASSVHYNGDSSYWVQKSGSAQSALSTFIPFQQPATRPPSASSSRSSSGSARSALSSSPPAAGYVPVPPPAVSSAAVRRPLFVAPPPPLPQPTARVGPPVAVSSSPPATLFASSSTLPALLSASSAPATPTLSAAAVFIPATTAPSLHPFLPTRVPALSAARTAHLSAVVPITSAATTTASPYPAALHHPVHPPFHPATATASHIPHQSPSGAATSSLSAGQSLSPSLQPLQYAHSPSSPGLLSASTTPVPSRPVSPALPSSISSSSVHATPAILSPSPPLTQPVALPTTSFNTLVVAPSHVETSVLPLLPTDGAASVTKLVSSTAATALPSRVLRATSVVPTARRAHLIAKAKQLSEQRAQRQQQEVQRLAQLQASLSTSQASTHSQRSLNHELDSLVAVDDALHTRYLLHTQQLQRKLVEQQDNMQQLSQAILRLQHIIASDNHTHTTLALSPAFYQQESTLLQSHLVLLQQRLLEKEEEVALLSSMMVKKSARVSEVREEASVVVDEMRAAVKRLGADKERREREMREEREQLMSGLREMIDRCVRENEWMRLRLGEEGRAEMERWKESEESRMEEREHDRQRMLQKERLREKEKEAEREREERLQLQRLEDERQREERDNSRRQQEADMVRQKEDEVRRQQEELKQPEPESAASTHSNAAHFIARPGTVLTSSLSTVPSPASSTRHVHFRHPSASPTVFYEPASSSAPPSPLPLPLSAGSLHSHNHSPSFAAFQSSQHKSAATEQFKLSSFQYPPYPPPPPASYVEPQLHSVSTPSHLPPVLPSFEPASLASYPSNASTDEFDSYFSGAAAQPHLVSHSPSLASPGADATMDYRQQHTERSQPHSQSANQSIALTPPHAHMQQRVMPLQESGSTASQPSVATDASLPPHTYARPSTSTSAVPLTASTAASNSSLSDRVMGRIGGWMLGGAGRDRKGAAASNEQQHQQQPSGSGQQ